MKKVLFLLVVFTFLFSCGKEKAQVENNKKNTEEVKIEDNLESEMVNEVEIKEETEKKEEIVKEYVEEKVAEEKNDLKYKISRSRLSYLVENREPVEEKKEFLLNERAYFFNEFVEVGNETKKINHKWYHFDKEGNKNLIATVTLDIRGKRWRTWSSKKLYLKGEWQVEVEDNNGNVILTENLKVK